MRKSSAIFVSAIALGLAMVVPLKASAQGVTIYVNPGYPGYGAGYPGYGAGAYIRLIPATMGTVIRVTVTPIQAMVTPIQAMGTAAATAMAAATATALHITALIGAIIDALRAEFIGGGTAGIRLL